MTTMYIATGDALAVVSRRNDRWQADLQLQDLPTQCLAADPLGPERVYCGTFGRGLWRSEDAGASWQPARDGMPYVEVMSVAVSPLERAGDYGIVWAGTEPSALFRSEDGGNTWQERPTLRELPSAPTWSFPPRPWTHHVRWITPDPNEPGRLFVGIELGGVMRSLDAGLTWEDRKPGAQPDAHTLSAHRLAPGRVYEAAGGGYAESRDGGGAWQGYDAGMRHHYVWSLAADPARPDTVVVSAASGPGQAHNPTMAESTVYRRSGVEPWREIRTGLPEPKGSRVYVLTANEVEPGMFYLATHRGEMYRSPDAGLTWEQMDVVWPDGYRPQNAHALAVVETV